MKLKAFFTKGATNTFSSSQQTTSDAQASTPSVGVVKRLKSKSSFVPPAFNHSVATFCRLVEHDVFTKLPDCNKSKAYSNLGLQEKNALVDLQKDNSIVIKSADKGGAVVVQNRESYRQEIFRQLSNVEFYTPLSGDPTLKFSHEIESFLSRALSESFISQDEFNFMFQKHPVRPVFHTLPKIHKSCIEPVPGRPIVAGIQSLSEPISQYIDLQIKGLVFQLPSFLKDTTDFLNKIDAIENIQESDFLCSLDITSLYTNVPNQESLISLAYYLNQRGNLTPPTDFLVELMKLVLNRNYFKFENSYYLQCQGVSMGSPCSPNFANLFMGKFEEDFVYNNNPFSTLLRCWYRFIDDVFCIFTGSFEQLQEFKVYISSRMPTIKFTLEHSQQSISFLDVMVTKKSEQLDTKVYRKETDRNSFLDFSSYHTPGLKKGLPYSQLVRIKRICSSEMAFEEQAADLCSRFREKGYREDILNDALQRARDLDRNHLLKPKPSSSSISSNKIVCATTFSPLSKDLRQIVEKHWHMLQSDPCVGKSFSEMPVFAHKRAKNLRDTLVRADLYNPPKHFLSTLPSGNFLCNSCIHCNAMIKSESFLHPHSGKKYAVKGRISCKTKYVVYMLKCPCGLC